MIAWPRSLLWRTVVMLVPLLVVSQLAWFALLSLSEREPRARQIAERVSSVVNLTRAALIGSRPEGRRALLAELNESEGIRVYPGDDSLPEGTLGTGPVIGHVVAELRRRLGEDTIIYDARGGERALWVSFMSMIMAGQSSSVYIRLAWEVFAAHNASQTRDSHALPRFGPKLLPQPLYCCSASLCHLLPWRASPQGLPPAHLHGCALPALPSLEQGEQTDDKCTDAAIAISAGGFIHHQLVYC